MIGLTITGEVEKFATVSPPFVRLNGSAGELIRNKITITPTEKYDFSIIGFQMQNGKNITVDFKTLSSEKKGWEIIVSNKRKDAGKYSDTLTIKTDSPVKKELKIRIYGSISTKKIPVE